MPEIPEEKNVFAEKSSPTSSADIDEMQNFLTKTGTIHSDTEEKLHALQILTNQVVENCGTQGVQDMSILHRVSDLHSEMLVRQSFVETVQTAVMIADQTDESGVKTVSNTAIHNRLLANGYDPFKEDALPSGNPLTDLYSRLSDSAFLQRSPSNRITRYARERNISYPEAEFFVGVEAVERLKLQIDILPKSDPVRQQLIEERLALVDMLTSGHDTYAQLLLDGEWPPVAILAIMFGLKEGKLTIEQAEKIEKDLEGRKINGLLVGKAIYGDLPSGALEALLNAEYERVKFLSLPKDIRAAATVSEYYSVMFDTKYYEFTRITSFEYVLDDLERIKSDLIDQGHSEAELEKVLFDIKHAANFFADDIGVLTKLDNANGLTTASDGRFKAISASQYVLYRLTQMTGNTTGDKTREKVARYRENYAKTESRDIQKYGNKKAKKVLGEVQKIVDKGDDNKISNGELNDVKKHLKALDGNELAHVFKNLTEVQQRRIFDNVHGSGWTSNDWDDKERDEFYNILSIGLPEFPDPPPKPLSGDGSAKHGSSSDRSLYQNLLGDDLSQTKWYNAADAADLLGKDTAARHMRHYLDNSGETLTIYSYDMIKDLPGFEKRVAQTIEEDLKKEINTKIAANHKNEIMEFQLTTDWDDYYVLPSESDDWFYALGGFSYSVGATVIVTPQDSGTPLVSVRHQTYVFDRYNWDEGKSVDIFGMEITDESLGELHEAGIAQEYEIRGRSETGYFEY